MTAPDNHHKHAESSVNQRQVRQQADDEAGAVSNYSADGPPAGTAVSKQANQHG